MIEGRNPPDRPVAAPPKRVEFEASESQPFGVKTTPTSEREALDREDEAIGRRADLRAITADADSTSMSLLSVAKPYPGGTHLPRLVTEGVTTHQRFRLNATRLEHPSTPPFE